MAELKVLELLEATQAFERKLGLALMYSALRLPQFRAMLFLEQLGKITVSDLSRHLNVTRATVSVLVNELMRAELVESLNNSADKRSFYLRLTESGIKRLALAKKEVSMVADSLSENLNTETVDALNQFACQVRRDR
ncbi:MAG: MarR family transcriptional regulator [Gammaproteobacteria bacterium]|nr:MAG: MarR family transcriptional regulator [Gammaproteobacteria bacterium]